MYEQDQCKYHGVADGTVGKPAYNFALDPTNGFYRPATGVFGFSKAISSGSNGGTVGSVLLNGNTSGQAKITVPAAAGTPTLTLGSSSGTPAVTASAPLAITAATGNITFDNTAWTSFTPSPVCGTATFTSNSARFKQIGKIVFVSYDITFTALGTCGVTTLTMATPVSSAGFGASMAGKDIGGTSNKTIGCSISGATTSCLYADATTWVNGARVFLSGVYEAP